jgi:hypothetical protein
MPTQNAAVVKMSYIGVVTGYSDGTFKPNNDISRQEAAVMLSRFMNALGYNRPIIAPNFKDIRAIADWARDHVGKVQSAGIMNGVENEKGEINFVPNGKYTREQAIVTMVRLWDLSHIPIPDGGGLWYQSGNPFEYKFYLPKNMAQAIFYSKMSEFEKDFFIGEETDKLIEYITTLLGVSELGVLFIAIGTWNSINDMLMSTKFGNAINNCNDDEFVVITVKNNFSTIAHLPTGYDYSVHSNTISYPDSILGNFIPMSKITENDFMNLFGGKTSLTDIFKSN